MSPAPEDRLAPDVRALVDAMTAFFPDLGGAVTDAAEARRTLAAAPVSPFPPPVAAGSPSSTSARTATGPTRTSRRSSPISPRCRPPTS
ncbi:hypothetical protein [Streptomyces sp. NPDC059349]|uniref:hypothetical protein n=1 Tax=Streptomyces sp. NPDC059349 TaxID=3346808 RepID=UPI00367E9515